MKAKKAKTEKQPAWQMDVTEVTSAGCLVNSN
jgi:hypothetical protein